MTILVTGGAGFIGSEFIRQVCATTVGHTLINLDALTYAGNVSNLAGLTAPRYTFVQGDVCDAATLDRVFTTYTPDLVVHFAAESHVDRSILDARDAMQTNILGTVALLEAVRRHPVRRLVAVSTDEVYGDIPIGLFSVETDPLHPSSPYAASKAAADLLCLAYRRTYGVPVVITRGANTYGPHQYPEKLIPLMITRLLAGQPLPVYGDGTQVRDWLHVADHCRAILGVLLAPGDIDDIYNIPGHTRLPNNDLIQQLITTVRTHVDPDVRATITRVTDRPGHDYRYAMSGRRLQRICGTPVPVPLTEGLIETVLWYARQPPRMETPQRRGMSEQDGDYGVPV